MIGSRRFLSLGAFVAAMLLWMVCGRVAAASTAELPSPGTVLLIDLHDTLQPERASVFARQLRHAEQDNMLAVVVDLSTPGGLPDSADAMVAVIRQATIPVIVWAGTPQTRISGEGLRLMAEADVALMQPATFLTPLWTERPHDISPEARAAASERLKGALADAVKRHGRNAAIVDELASGTHWFSASEAVQSGFVDGIALRPEDLLRAVQGRIIQRDGAPVHLDLAGAKLMRAGTEPQEMLMLALMNPDLAVLLLTLGLLLIYLEINTPGAVIPGAAGVLLVLLAAYALHLLPLNWVGVLLCLGAALLLLLEARFASHGVLAAGGIVLLVIGLAVLVRGPMPQLQVAWGTAIGAGVGFGGVTATLMVLGMQARRAKVKTGSEAMLGWLAVAQTPLAPEGHILVRGELWRARLTTNDSFVAAGDRVKVLRADGLTLEVTAIPLSNTV